MSSLNKNDGNMCQKMAAMITAEATIYCLKEQKNTEYFEKCIKKEKMKLFTMLILPFQIYFKRKNIHIHKIVTRF